MAARQDVYSGTFSRLVGNHMLAGKAPGASMEPSSAPRCLEPDQATFVLLAFEGPDSYARAGGLGVRVTELSQALSQRGYAVHLLFVGDPRLPGREERLRGRLILHRWCQWISAYHPGGVYDGEDGKVRDFTDSVPWFVVEQVVLPAVESGRRVIVMAEEWQTAQAVCRLDETLRAVGLREQVILLWNANNTMGFERVDWPRLAEAATITTVSRYMKHVLWAYGVNPLVIPNGIPQQDLRKVDPVATDQVRRSVGRRPMLVKVARWDPDKRWLMALEALACLKMQGRQTVLVARGGLEAHGGEVMHHANQLGLKVKNVALCAEAAVEPRCYAAAFADAGPADVLNVTMPIPHAILRVLYRAADGVLANSGREPFGLVGLEAMAAGGTAYTGNTGEEYVRHLQNAVVLDTNDPREAAWYITYLAAHPRQQAGLRQAARETASRFAWNEVLDGLLARLEFLAANSGDARQV